MKKKSFDPVCSDESEILILGSLPGDKSLEMQEYYAHKRNRFWEIISKLCDSEIPQTYANKKGLLLNNHIALWDVAHNAVRKGSMDSAIQSEEPNDMDAFLRSHKNIKKVCFNGQKPEELFNKYFSRKEGIEYISLPSTSPANAKFKTEDLFRIWLEKIKGR